MIKFSTFLTERATTKYFRHPATKSHGSLIIKGRTATITGMHTSAEHRGKGGASHVLRQMTDHMDRHGLHGMLHAAPDDDRDQDKLKSLYARHGFETDGDDHEMIRKPRS